MKARQHWLLFATMLGLMGCKPRPLECEAEKYFQVADPQQSAGEETFDIDRLGPEVPRARLFSMPLFMTLSGGTHVRSEWLSSGHVASYASLVYSPREALARGVKNPADVYPMKRLTGGPSERVRLGFRSSICVDTEASQVNGSCREYGQQQHLFIADMLCKH